MAQKFLLYKRKTAIIFTDCLLFATIFSIYGVYHFKYHWSIGIVTFLGLLFAFFYAFFTFRILRYILSVAFSILYGGIFAMVGVLLDKENPITPAIVFGVLSFLISIYLHKDHFDFLKDSKKYEYDRY